MNEGSTTPAQRQEIECCPVCGRPLREVDAWTVTINGVSYCSFQCGAQHIRVNIVEPYTDGSNDDD